MTNEQISPTTNGLNNAITRNFRLWHQCTINGEINPMDVLIATYVTAFTANTGLWGTVGWNAAGGAASNYLKGDAPLTGAGWGAAGSAFGYSIGKVVQILLDKVLNPSGKIGSGWIWGWGSVNPYHNLRFPGWRVLQHLHLLRKAWDKEDLRRLII